MFPQFKKGDYGAGLVAASQSIESILTNPDAVAEIMSGEPDADRRRADGDGTSILTVFAVIGCALGRGYVAGVFIHAQ